MASHVVVVDSSFRRHSVKTTPAKPLTDVLQEACSKFGLDASNYTLKHNDKTLDLSRAIRLSGLQPGARLTLVQASRSPSVVNVALQLPPTGEQSGSLSRLTEKFPSDTTIWQILRRFESGVAGGNSTANTNMNLTQRATAQITNGSNATGAGRLCYEMPVINIMGRELANLSDLQKTLSQLGYNGGSALMRLHFRNTQQPLEEAMTEISQFFQHTEDPVKASESQTPQQSTGQIGDDLPVTAAEQDQPMANQENGFPAAMNVDPPNILAQVADTNRPELSATETQSSTREQSHDSTTSKLSIFAPPSSSTPAAASFLNHNEADYVPTIDHAKLHQARLEKESRNRRLLSDVEIAKQEQERSQSLADIKQIHVRLRFPDQSSAQQTFDRDTTVRNLYALCRNIMERPNNENIIIRVAGNRGAAVPLDECDSKLISDLGWKGGVLVTVAWADDVSVERRNAPALKEEYRSQAQKLVVTSPSNAEGDASDVGEKVDASAGKSKGKAGGSEVDKEAKLKKLLGFSKFGKK